MKKIALIALIFACGLMAEEIKECKTKADTLTSCVLTLENGRQKFYENGEYVREKEKIDVEDWDSYLWKSVPIGYYFRERGYDGEAVVWVKHYYSNGDLCYSWEYEKTYKVYDKNGEIKWQGVWENENRKYKMYDKDGQIIDSYNFPYSEYRAPHEERYFDDDCL